MGLDLSAHDQALLYKHTEGWIAGLQLFALSLQGIDEERRQDFVMSYDGGNRYIADYLASEKSAYYARKAIRP
jgi:LuxR family maltose regulon positive regulatory protein